jgi:hypothetical protein
VSTHLEIGDDTRVLPAAPPRLAAGKSGALAVVLAILTALTGAVLIHEALVAAGVVGGTSVIAQLTSFLDAQRPSPTAVLTGLLMLLVGLVLLWLALRPRRRIGLALRGPIGAYLDPRSLDSLVQSRALSVPGVIAASTHGNAKRLRLEVSSTAGDVDGAVREAVLIDLDALARPPSLRVDVRPAEGSVPADEPAPAEVQR